MTKDVLIQYLTGLGYSIDKIYEIIEVYETNGALPDLIDYIAAKEHIKGELHGE